MEKQRLSKKFYLQDPVTVAKELLGKYLYRKTDHGLIVNKIVETEAYLSKDDPACHAYTSRTARNYNMFEEGGVSYVYIIYGCYHCFNIVTGKKGDGEAVLIRALEPVDGINIMQEFREVKKIKDLTNGPSKLCLSLNVTKKENGLDLINCDELYITEGDIIQNQDIVVTTRIGLTKGIDLPLRFYLNNNIYVSKLAKK